MKTLIIFYSYSGTTRARAQQIAKTEGADTYEVKELKKRSVLSAYLKGCFEALKQRKVEIEPITADLNAYERIIIMMPVWASYPAPAFNNVIEVLPAGKQVELMMLSKSGNSKKSEANSIALVKSKGCQVQNYSDIKP